MLYSLFFFANSGVSPNLIYKKNKIPIPNEREHIRLDGKIGTDMLYLFYLKNPLDFEALQAALKSLSNKFSFRQKINQRLSKKLASPAAISCSMSKDMFSFNLNNTSSTIAALFVEIEHID